MPRKPKPVADRELQRAVMIDAARELFITRGVEAVTMREIAKLIGCSATAIYLHFHDKESLLRAVCDADLLTLANALKDTLKISDPVQRMLQLGVAYAKFALQYPNHYRLMFMTPHPPCTPELSSLQQNNIEQDAYFLLKSVVNDVFKAGKFKAHLTDPELIAQTLWAGTHGVCSLEITLGQDTWVDWRHIERRVSAMQRALLDGLLKEPL